MCRQASCVQNGQKRFAANETRTEAEVHASESSPTGGLAGEQLFPYDNYISRTNRGVSRQVGWVNWIDLNSMALGVRNNGRSGLNAREMPSALHRE